MAHDMYWLLDLYEYAHTLRDRNDLNRRPPRGSVTYRRIESSGKVTSEPSDEVKARLADSSPENPQGGRWVKMRIEAGGMPMAHDQMMDVLRQQGYQEKNDGPQGR